MAEKKSICILTHSSGFGGMEVHTLGLIKSLLRRGFRIELVCCKHHFYDERIKSFGGDNIKLVHIDLGINDKGIGVKRKWKKVLSGIESETLILVKGVYHVGRIRFLRLCRQYFKHFYYIEHSDPPPMPPKTSKKHLGGLLRGVGLWWYREKLLRKVRPLYADKIISVSDGAAKSLVMHCGYPADKVKVVKNGIDCKHFVRNIDTGNAFRQRYGIPKDAFVFGMMTRLDYVKGIDIAIEAFHSLLTKQKNKNFYLVITGGGKEKLNLSNMAEMLKLNERVLFIGFVERPEDVFCSYDVILLPSNREGLPLALLEGMAAGCLPIVSNAGGMPEVVDQKELGWVINVGDIKGLSNAMSEALLLSESEMASRREAIVNKITRDFDAERSYQNIIDILELG